MVIVDMGVARPKGFLDHIFYDFSFPKLNKGITKQIIPMILEPHLKVRGLSMFIGSPFMGIL